MDPQRRPTWSPFFNAECAVAAHSRPTLNITVKSYFLEGIFDVEKATAVLNEELPGQTQPWLLRDPDGDVIAYVHIETLLDGSENAHICADVSGSHYSQDGPVLALLSRMQSRVGGVLQSDV